MGVTPSSACAENRLYVGCTADEAWQVTGLGEATIFDVYEIGGMLGSGSFGQVRLCWPVNEPDKRKFAVKVIDTKAEVFTQASAFISPRQESNILKRVKHPHIVELVDVFDRDRFLFLVMECFTGGELFSALGNPSVAVSEGSVATVGRQLMQALRYLHDVSIVHRDVKAENILLTSNPAKSGKWHIKLIDFGLAMRVEQPACIFGICREQEMPLEELICGTAYYCAPEVWINDYGPKVDVWAAGVVLYLALHGTYPFYDGDASMLEALICDPEREPTFGAVCARECPGYAASSSARRCISELLTKDTDSRPDAASALHLTWLQSASKRGAGLFGVTPKQREHGMSKNHGDDECDMDQAIPKPIRAKAGRAAARPPVDPLKEQRRTDALEELKLQATLNGYISCKGAALNSPSRASVGSTGWRSSRNQSRDLEVDRSAEVDSDVENAFRLGSHEDDTTLTDSDFEESPSCACR